MRAMVVDMSKSLSVLLSQHLASHQVKTITHTNGHVALGMLKQASCDLVVVAMHLDDMDGIEFVSKMRELDQHNRTHVVMLTTTENSEALADALRAGVNEIFQKDRVNHLLEHITNWSQNSKLHSTEGNILYVEV